MKARHTTIEILVWCLLLAIGSFFNVVWAEHSPSPSDTMKTDSLTEAQKYNFQSDDDKQRNVNDMQGSTKGAKTVKGELFRIDDAEYFVKAKDGTEVRLHTDKTTNMIGKIKKGDRIEATVNDQNHALSIQAIR